MSDASQVDLQRRVEELEKALACCAKLAKDNSVTLTQMELSRSAKKFNTQVLWWVLGAMALLAYMIIRATGYTAR